MAGTEIRVAPPYCPTIPLLQLVEGDATAESRGMLGGLYGS